MKANYNLCRLCKSTRSTETLDLYESSNLLMKIEYCTGIQISTEDNLPNSICKRCSKKINKFYDFKLKCLIVDWDFKYITHIENESHHEEKPTANNNVLHVDSKSDSHNENFTQELLVNENVTYNTICSENLNTHIIQCEQCGDVFETKTAFKKHVYLNHTRHKMFRCKHCPKMFTTAENCNTHIRSHLGIKQYVCEICGKASTKLSDLVRHMKIHSDEKNHNCQICGRGFKRSTDLIVHTRTHSGVRPYKCRLCEKDYTSHSGLRKHLKSHNKHNFEDSM